MCGSNVRDVLLKGRAFIYQPADEEQALVRFFGQDYVHYRANVGTKIPFIP